jgi:hypothetical protein
LWCRAVSILDSSFFILSPKTFTYRNDPNINSTAQTFKLVQLHNAKSGIPNLIYEETRRKAIRTQLPFDLFPHLLRNPPTFFSYFPTPKNNPIPRARIMPFFLHLRSAKTSHRWRFNKGERLRGGLLVETKTRSEEKQVLIFLAVME